MLILKINTLVMFTEEDDQLIEDKRNAKEQKTDIQKAQPTHDFVVVRKIVAVHCFVLPLAL